MVSQGWCAYDFPLARHTLYSPFFLLSRRYSAYAISSFLRCGGERLGYLVHGDTCDWLEPGPSLATGALPDAALYSAGGAGYYLAGGRVFPGENDDQTPPGCSFTGGAR